MNRSGAPARVAIIIDGGHYLSSYSDFRPDKKRNPHKSAKDFNLFSEKLCQMIQNTMPDRTISWERTDFFHATEDGQPEELHRLLQNMCVRVELYTFKAQRGWLVDHWAVGGKHQLAKGSKRKQVQIRVERGVDVALAVRIMMRAMGNDSSRVDKLYILSGDSDLAPALEEAERCMGRGSVVVIGGRAAVSNELKRYSQLNPQQGASVGPCSSSILNLEDIFEEALPRQGPLEPHEPVELGSSQYTVGRVEDNENNPGEEEDSSTGQDRGDTDISCTIDYGGDAAVEYNGPERSRSPGRHVGLGAGGQICFRCGKRGHLAQNCAMDTSPSHEDQFYQSGTEGNAQLERNDEVSEASDECSDGDESTVSVVSDVDDAEGGYCLSHGDTQIQASGLLSTTINSYVQRAFAQCCGDYERELMEEALKERLTALSADPTPLMERDWANEPLPNLYEEVESEAEVGTKRSIEAISKSPELTGWTGEKAAPPVKRFRPTLPPKDRPAGVTIADDTSFAVVDPIDESEYETLMHKEEQEINTQRADQFIEFRRDMGKLPLEAHLSSMERDQLVHDLNKPYLAKLKIQSLMTEQESQDVKKALEEERHRRDGSGRLLKTHQTATGKKDKLRLAGANSCKICGSKKHVARLCTKRMTIDKINSPGREKKCFLCGKVGHTQNRCKVARKQQWEANWHKSDHRSPRDRMRPNSTNLMHYNTQRLHYQPYWPPPNNDRPPQPPGPAPFVARVVPGVATSWQAPVHPTGIGPVAYPQSHAQF